MIRHIVALVYNFHYEDELTTVEYAQNFLTLIVENKKSIICSPIHFCSTFHHYVMLQQEKGIAFFNQNKKFFDYVFFYLKELLNGKFIGKKIYTFLLTLWTMFLRKIGTYEAVLYTPYESNEQIIKKSLELLAIYGYKPSFIFVYSLPSLIGGFRLEVKTTTIEFSMQRIISDIIKKIENGG